MDQIKEDINNKIKIIEDFIALSLRRDKVVGDVGCIVQEADELKKLMLRLNEKMDENLARLDEKYDKAMRRMRTQQNLILERLLAEKRRKLAQEEEDAKQLHNMLKQPTSTSKCLQPNSISKCLSVTKCVNSPKMSIADYQQSPLVRRIKLNPIPFTFTEFEYQITRKQFETIPKYMRGRDTQDELSNFLDTIIIPVFNSKYQLMYRQRSTVRHAGELEIWKLYNEQVAYVPGGRFITSGDISRFISRMVDRTMQRRITMLRHIGVLQEQRIEQTVCYIWSAN